MKKIFVVIISISISIFLVACNKSISPKNNEANNNLNKLTVEDAKNIAIEDAKLNNNNVQFVKEDLNIEDSIEKYDIEFYYNDKGYDYEINAYTGDITEYDNEVEDYTIIEPSKNESKLTIEQAKDIALNNSNITSDKVEFIKEEYKFDDGIAKYDIVFKHNDIRYNYDIDANNGNILEYKKEN